MRISIFFFNRIVFKIEFEFYKNYYAKDKENRNRRYSSYFNNF